MGIPSRKITIKNIFSLKEPCCIRCGDEKTRKSFNQYGDGALGKIFFTYYRCRGCHVRYRKFKRSYIGALGLITLLFVIAGSTFVNIMNIDSGLKNCCRHLDF